MKNESRTVGRSLQGDSHHRRLKPFLTIGVTPVIARNQARPSPTDWCQPETPRARRSAAISMADSTFTWRARSRSGWVAS
jgi:hypothetical protein